MEGILTEPYSRLFFLFGGGGGGWVKLSYVSLTSIQLEYRFLDSSILGT